MSDVWAIEDFAGKQSGGPEVGLGISAETMFTLQANGHQHAISSSADSRARTSAWPASGPVLGASVAVSGLSSTGCCPNCGHDGRSLRMFPVSLAQIMAETSPSYSWGWRNSGTGGPTEFSTRDTHESLNVGGECSLSAVLETDSVPARYFLSARAAAGILRRAERRGKELPMHLRQALEALATDTATHGTATT